MKKELLLSILMLVTLMVAPMSVNAEETRPAPKHFYPITVIATEPFTAAEFTVTVAGANTEYELLCGNDEDGIEVVVEGDDKCVVYHNAGGLDQATLASIVSDDDRFEIENFAGRVSTSQGLEPLSYSMAIGSLAEFTNEAEVTNLPSPTPAPIPIDDRSFLFGVIASLGGVLLLMLSGYFFHIQSKERYHESY